MRNIAARDALLASPAHRDAYLARHDALAANPLLVVTASVRHIVGDAHLRWSPGLRVDQALPMFRAALCALRRHTDKTAAAAAGGATAASPAGAGAAATAVHPVPATSTSPRGLIVTRIPPRDASALPQHSSLVYACTSEWGNWVEFQSPTLGYAICAQASTDVQGACAS